jgi:hypothetical protein
MIVQLFLNNILRGTLGLRMRRLAKEMFSEAEP